MEILEKIVKTLIMIAEGLAQAGIIPKDKKKDYVIEKIIEISNEIPVIKDIPDNLLKFILSGMIDLAVLYFNLKYGKDWLKKLG